MRTALVLLPLLLLCTVSISRTKDYRDDWFEFVVPDLAGLATRDSPIDLSFLSPEPAGTHGFLRARGEDLVDDRGVAVRLFGSNICDFHPMPPKEYAPRIAKRLQQLGINFIRFHYYDWAPAPKGMMNADMQTLNPAKLDEFHFFISELKKCGVYVDVNLHVARRYVNMPEDWDWMGKSIDRVHDAYVESQKRFAKDLLTAVNPYTGKSIADEPAVVAIELNNENSVFQNWLKFAGLLPRFTKPLKKKWNAWLRGKYGTMRALEKSWLPGGEPGPELLRNTDLSRGRAEWDNQNSGKAESTLTVAGTGEDRILRWNMTKKGSAGWHLQFFQSSVPVHDGKRYILAFQARSPESHELEIKIMQQQDPWNTVTSEFAPQLTPEWKDYTISFKVGNASGTPARLNFSSRNAIGTIELASLSLREGVVNDFKKGENLAAGTIALGSTSSSHLRLADFAEFLADLEKRNTHELIRYLKNDLKVKCLVWDTQVNYSGLYGLVREMDSSDAIDNHAYPAHPWGEQREGWSTPVKNVSMLGGAFGGLETMALRRVAGKPFFVTEFDLNPPNDYNAETIPMLSLLASYQNWNGIAEYSWLNFQGEYSHDPLAAHAWRNFQGTYGHYRMMHNYHTTGNAGQMATVPASALMFRLGLVKPSPKRATMVVHSGQIPEIMAGENGWFDSASLWRRHGARHDYAWLRGIEIQYRNGDRTTTATRLPEPSASIVSDTGEIVFNRKEEGRERLIVNAPAFRMFIGRTNGNRVRIGDVTVRIKRGFDDYVNVSLVAIDGKPVAQSRKLLLTALARVENKGQIWNKDRTAVQWGEGPTLAEPVELELRLPHGQWRARAIDGNGQPAGDVPVKKNRLTTAAKYHTVWYLIERD